MTLQKGNSCPCRKTRAEAPDPCYFGRIEGKHLWSAPLLGVTKKSEASPVSLMLLCLGNSESDLGIQGEEQSS